MFGEVRTMTNEKGEIFFVGKDVAKALGYSNTRDALSRHVDVDDKGVVKRDTLRGTQNLTIINESGLYALVLSSKLPKAKKFKRWAPSSENDTESYILNVCARTGLDRNAPLCRPTTPKGAWQMAVLMAAMTCVECGCWWEHVDFYRVCLGVYMAYPILIEDEAVRRLEYR